MGTIYWVFWDLIYEDVSETSKTEPGRPPSAFPDGNPTELFSGSRVTTMKWCLPALLPDKIFRCSVEARFETNTSVHWWTPLMMSEEFVVERMPPAAPPELAPVAELPTPQLMKLLARRAPGSTTYLVVRWPWSVQGRPVDILRDACHALEFCPSGARQSLKDSSAKPLDPKGETVVLGRATGPWKEPKAQQVCFANFEKGEVWFELPEDATVEPNWVPLLVASGLWTSSDHASEPHSVHLRWRLKAGPSDVAVTSAALHYSAATGPVRTFVGCPSASSLHLAVPQRISRLAGAVKHQFCYRLLSHQKKRKRGAGLQTLKSTDSESSDYTEDGWLSSSPLPQASHLQAVTGWLELPPISDDVKRLRQMPEAVGSEAELLGEPEEASCLAEFTRRLSPMEWQRLAWRHYHQRQEEFFDPAERDRDGESTMELTSQFQTSMSVRSTPSQAAADLADARQRCLQSMMSTGNSSSKSRADKKDVPFRLRSTHSVEWRVRVSDGIRWSDWSAPSEPAGMVPPIPTLSGPVRLFFNRREPTILRVWSGCEPLQGYEHLMDSIEYLLYLSIDEESGSQFIQEEGNFDVQKLHRRGVYLSDGSSGCLLPFEEDCKETPKFDFESLFSDKSQKRLLGKFRQKEIRTVRADSADGDEQSATVTGFDLMVSGLKPHCLHRISVCGNPQPHSDREAARRHGITMAPGIGPTAGLAYFYNLDRFKNSDKIAFTKCRTCAWHNGDSFAKTNMDNYILVGALIVTAVMNFIFVGYPEFPLEPRWLLLLWNNCVFACIFFGMVREEVLQHLQTVDNGGPGRGAVMHSHFWMLRRVQRGYACFDAYARIGLVLAAQHMLLVCAYYSLGHFMSKMDHWPIPAQNPGAAWLSLIAGAFCTTTLFKLDLFCGPKYRNLVQLTLILPPLLSGLAIHLAASRTNHGRGGVRACDQVVPAWVPWALALLACTGHMIWMWVILRVSSPLLESSGLPLSFRSTIYLDLFGWHSRHLSAAAVRRAVDCASWEHPEKMLYEGMERRPDQKCLVAAHKEACSCHEPTKSECWNFPAWLQASFLEGRNEETCWIDCRSGQVVWSMPEGGQIIDLLRLSASLEELQLRIDDSPRRLSL
eukprot:s303_g3.t3